MRARLLMLALAVSACLESSAWALPSFVVSEPLVVPRRPIDLAVGDLNNDGIDDLAIVSRGTNKVSIVLVEPDGTFRQGASLTIGSRMKSVGIGDFNGDGKGDVVVTTGTRNIFVIPGNGDGTFGRSQSIKRCCTGAGVTVADFDGSRPGALLGDDIAIADPSNDDVNVLINQNKLNSATFTLPGLRPRAGNKPQFILSDDFTGDGKKDIGALNTQGTGNDVSSIRNDANGSVFNNLGNFFAGKRARAMGSGDYNKDGTIDVVSCDQRTNSIVLMPNQGGGFFGTGPTIAISCAIDEAVTPTLCKLRAAQIKDFDGDGNPDIATLLSGINTIRVFVGTAGGEAFLDPIPVLNVGNDARVMKLGRFNNDDKPDMVVASVGDSSVRLILNTSGGGGVPTNTPTTGGTVSTPTPTPPPGSTATRTPTVCRGQGCPCDIDNGDADCNEPFLCAVNGEVCCDTDCAIDNVTCDLPGFEGTCKPIDMPDGDECSVGDQCQSGFCVDGVCCESACTGSSQRCNVTPGQCTEEGTVRPTATPTPTVTGNGGGGTPTATTRLKELGEDCTAGAECRSTFCPSEDLVCCNTACNGANQRCDLPTVEGQCLPINLDDGEDCVVDPQCKSAVCEGGVCVGDQPTRTPTPKKTNGGQCTDNTECDSGICQSDDDVCCNEVCDGENERCDLDPLAGTCLETDVPNGGNCQLDQQCRSRICTGNICQGDGPTPVFTATRTPNGSRIPTNTRTATPISQPTLILARGSGCSATDNGGGAGSLALLLAFPAWWAFSSRATAPARRRRQKRR